ncbi:hypothetical protein BDP27DRAFT_814288 [Rhodocollybia butyracea]|uniref:FYVE zinc finger domain-containing protein n=1 Tax=Rhodocollybia butyracea TaxID=206335 RepID=A0A9P5U6Y2_9AGAR|nr:hypothetical protein BDP27DRAFT_814288 [Rhodocollybia butyracea]
MSQTMSTDIRQNEHLAVLLPRTLWKRDSLATSCDTFACSTVFSNIPALPSLSISSLSSMSLSNFNIARTERRHHCRKCGGVFLLCVHFSHNSSSRYTQFAILKSTKRKFNIRLGRRSRECTRLR